MDELFRQTVYLRMGERVALTAVIVILALIVTVGFWRSLQRVEFRADKSVGLGGNFVLATPVFVLLALVGYAWVTLNAPVSFVPQSTAPQSSDTEVAQVASHSGGEFTAVLESATPEDFALRQARVLGQVRALNCLAERAQSTGPVDVAVLDALAETKLSLLDPVWAPEWGDFLVLNDWALGFVDAQPADEALRLFLDVTPQC